MNTNVECDCVNPRAIDIIYFVYLFYSVIAGTPLLTSRDHTTSLFRFIMVLASDTEDASYVCQYMNFFSFFSQYTKQILKLCYKSNTLIPNNSSQ